MPEDTVVISGLAGRFPGADDVDNLWDKLLQGSVLYSEEKERHPKRLRHRPSALGQINDLSRFDGDFFGYNTKDSELIGTQTRILHEVVYEALWDAGLVADSLRGSNTGFIVGISAGDGVDLYDLDKTAHPVYIFSRVPHFFDWKGPCLSIDTACASTADAIIQAHWHIKKGLCDIVVVAGVNTVVDPFVNVTAADMKMLSTSGFERCLDDNADGFIRSETVAALVLQRKTDAKRIYGEILGTSVNNDGYTEEGITFPNRYAQAGAMRSALKVAKIPPSQIDYIEAHITGTQAGDAVETSAILDAYRENSDQPIKVGCIKSNIGHAEASAGINAVIRACKILQTGYLSPNAAYSTPNSRIPGLLEGKIVPVLNKQPFNSLCLGVNTFGFGGSNGHIILKKNSKETRSLDLSTFPRLITFCNRTRQGIEMMNQHLLNCNSLSEDLIAMLSELSQIKPESGLIWRGYSILSENGKIDYKKISLVNRPAKKLCFFFNDSTSPEYYGLTRFKAFRDSIQSSLSFLKSKGVDITNTVKKNNLTSKNEQKSAKITVINKIVYQLAIVDLLHSIGIGPDLVIGSSANNVASRYASNQLNRNAVLTNALNSNSTSNKPPPQQYSGKAVLEKYGKLFKNGFTDSSSTANGAHVHLINKNDYNKSEFSLDDWIIISIDGQIRLMDPESTECDILHVEKPRPLQIENTLISEEVTQFLQIIGNLYLLGYNVNISALYPPIAFPIGRQAPSLSPFLVWNHSDKHEVCSCLEFYDNMTNVCYTVDLTDPEFEEVSHHIYDDRTLMPAVGYIYLLWKAMVFNKIGDSVNFKEYGFRVWDVRIHRATIINDSAVFKVFYNPVTHKFNVTFRDQVCVSGFGDLISKEENFDFENYMSVETNPEALEMTGERFYLGLKVQGFQYGDKMRNIVSTTTDHTYARIKYSGGWIGLADSFVQLGGLTTAMRTPRVPVGFQELVYDPNAFSEALEMVPVINEKEENNEAELEVYLCHEVGTITTYGVYLKGLQFTGAPQKPEQTNLRYARQLFKPHNCENFVLSSSIETMVANYLLDCYELLQNYSQQFHVQTCIEMKESWSSYLKFETRYKLFTTIHTALTQPARDLIDELLSDPTILIKDPIVDLVFSRVLGFTMNVYESELCKKMVNITSIGVNNEQIVDQVSDKLSSFAVRGEISSAPKPGDKPSKPIDLLVYNHHSLSLCGAMDGNCNDENSVLECVGPDNFVIVNYRDKLLSFEKILMNNDNINSTEHDWKNDVSRRMERLDFILIARSRHQETGLVSVLYKKRPVQNDNQAQIIHIDATSCKWVDDIQAALDEKDVDKVWLIANDSYRNGIVGLVKCLRFEPFGDKIRCVFWPGKTIVDLNDLDQQIIRKDLRFNINIDGNWGIYHLDEIPVDEDVRSSSTNCYVDVGKKGDLTSLAWFKSLDEDKSAELIDEEVSDQETNFNHENVNTFYATLNFRDILLATGRLSADAYPPNNVETLIGTEFSGITESGRRVMGICHGKGIATQIPGKNISILFDVPDKWSLEEAATIPNVYLTVYYALCVRGGLKPGESVLIHSGSGGVGQAAISLCLARGCQVFTTVSTQAKRNFLKSMFPGLSDSSFADSRSIQFEEHILRQTNGRGVDVVLNSLTEDKLQSGLRCVAEGGRFLELGKYDIVQNNNFDYSTLRNNCSFQVVCLSFVINKICENSWEGRLLAEQFQKLFTRGIESDEIRPIASHIFKADQAEDAFRLMAKSRHMGKVLIQIRDEKSILPLAPLDCICQTYFHPHKSYIIVGGLGGMGLELAYWMVSRGARNLLITSRSGFKSDNERGFIEFLRYYRYRRHNIIVTINDAMSITMTAQLIDSASRLGPIGGIFNLAMVLKDGLFENQTSETFELVCGPKIKITQNLDKLSRQLCPYLDYFVCFSSIATLGSVGQSNYAFANSFMERVCEERRKDGLPAVAVQWGPVADVGVAARLTSEKDLIIFGFAAQNIFSCFRALDKFMQLPDAVCQSCVISSGTQQEVSQFENIFQRIAHILGIKDIDALDPNTTLNELGLDSLQSIEVKEYFGRQYNLSLDDKPLGSLKIADIRDLSRNLQSKDVIKEEALD